MEYATRLIEPLFELADASCDDVRLAATSATRPATTIPIVLIRTINPPYYSIFLTVYVEKVEKAVYGPPPWSSNGNNQRMWISRRTDYATRAILALALDGGGPLKLEELAHRTGAPQSVLEQVMPAMRSAGLVRSERGPSGGYRLNKEPDEITLERVVRLFQGQLAPIGYATRRSPDAVPKFVADSLRGTWSEVRDSTIEILERTTFADLAKRAGGSWREGSSELVP